MKNNKEVITYSLNIYQSLDSLFTPLKLENREVTFGTLLYYLILRYFLYLANKLEELAHLLETP